MTVGNSNPAPVMLEPEVASLPSTVYAPWNTFFGMVNVAELSNNNSTALSVAFVMRDGSGQALSTGQVSLPAQSKFDLLLSDLVSRDLYGTVQFTVTGTNSEAFRCDITNYRFASTTGGRAFDYAFSIPCEAPKYGISAVLTNRFFPGDATRRVSNWLTLSNLASSTHEFTVRTYSQSGELANTQAVSLPALSRLDLDASQFADITLATVTPDDGSAPYLAVLNRYDDGVNNTRVLAFGSNAQTGDSDTRCVPISNLIGSANYTEMGNVLGGATTVSAIIYGANGAMVDTGTISLPAHGVQHVDFAGQLPIGTAGSLCLSAELAQALIFNQATYYFTSGGALSTGFLTTPNKLSGVSSIFGAKNFFFGTYNWLRLMNTTNSSQVVDITADPGDSGELMSSYTLGAHQRLDIALHDSPFGKVVGTYGRFRVQGLVAADAVRVIPNTNAPDGPIFTQRVP